ESGADRARLESAVHHAVLTARVAALAAIAGPVRLFHQLAERARIPVLQQVARALPAEDVVGGVPPGRALKVALPHQKLEEERRLVELPAPLRRLQHARKEPVGTL